MNLTILNNKSSATYFVVLAIMSVITIFVIALLLYDAEKTTRIDHLKISEQNKLDLQVHEILNDFSFVERDVLLLRDLVALLDVHSCGEGKTLSLLKSELFQYVKQKGFYDQVRFIDELGMEKIRVNYNSGKPEVVEDRYLQSKADRYYFKELKSRSYNELYFSKLDLNMEHDSIEIPHKPLLRVGIRVVDCEGQFSGIVLVNYVTNNLIWRIEELNVNNLSQTHILEPNGYFLVSPDHDNNWGFMFPDRKHKNYPTIYPAAWDRISNNKQGQFLTAHGLYTFRTLSFDQVVGNANVDNLSYYSTDSCWKVISFVSSNELDRLNASISSHFYIPVSLLVLLSIIISFILAFLKLKDFISKQLIVEKNDFLSSVINSISEPLYVLSPSDYTIHLANKRAHHFAIREGAGFEHNLLFMSNEEARAIDDFREELVTTKQDQQLELTVRGNGSANYYVINGYPILDPDGRVSKIIEVVNDITDEKLSEQKFKDLLSSAPDGMIITNSVGDIEMVNSQAEQMFKYKEADLLGKKIEVLIASRSDDHIKQRNWALQVTDFGPVGVDKELIGLKSDGIEFPVEISLGPIHTSEGLLIASSIRDITDRKMADRMLKESEQKFRALFNNQSQFIGLLDTNGTLIEVNETALKFSGLSFDNVQGTKLWDVPWWATKELAQDVCNAVQIAATGVYIRYEVDIVGRNQQTITIDFSLQPIKDDDGNVILIIPEGKDITEKKTFEKALKNSEKQLKSFVKHTPNAVAMFDTDLKYLLASDQWYRDYNFVGVDIIGKSHYQVFPEITKMAEWQNYHQRCLAGESIAKEEDMFVREDGTVNWIRWEIHPWFDEANQIGGIIMYTEEITERKNIEEELFEQAQILNQVVESVVTTDMDGIIQTWNHGAEELFGHTVDEIKGKHIAVIYPGNEDGRLNNEVVNQLFKKGRHVIEVNLVRKSGEIFYGHLSLSLKRDRNNNVVGMIGSTIDITQNVRNQEEIRKLNESLEQKVADRTQMLEKAYRDVAISKEEAEQANMAKSEFLANMSHEIRTPMNAVIGFSEILSRQLEDPVQKDFVEAIRSSGKTLLGIINDVLDLSKIEAGKLDVQRESVDINTLVKDINALFFIRAKERNLDFRIKVSDNLPKAFIIDELRVKQVLINLLSNAIKFTDEGFVQLSIGFVAHQAGTVDLSFSVQDSGIGISSDDMDKIFEAFHQKEGQITKKYGGTGLGLTISNKIADLMNGQISVNSTLGKGSVFCFTMHGVKVAGTQPNMNNKLDLAQEKIVFEYAKVLIVDDIQRNRKLLKSFLAGYNMEFEEATDGLSGVEACISFKPNLIFMDIRMPRMDGYQAVKEIRKIKEFEKTPIIAVTASVHLETYLLEGNNGFNGLLHKPLVLSDLLRVLTLHLPHTKLGKRGQVSKDVAQQVDLSAIVLTDKLQGVLKNELEPTVRQLSIRKSSVATKELSQKLLEIGKAYQVPQFVQVGQELNFAVKAFNIVASELIIKDFVGYYNRVIV